MREYIALIHTYTRYGRQPARDFMYSAPGDYEACLVALDEIGAEHDLPDDEYPDGFDDAVAILDSRDSESESYVRSIHYFDPKRTAPDHVRLNVLNQHLVYQYEEE